GKRRRNGSRNCNVGHCNVGHCNVERHHAKRSRRTHRTYQTRFACIQRACPEVFSPLHHRFCGSQTLPRRVLPMIASPTYRNRLLPVCFATLGMLWTTHASADVDTCVESHSRGQVLRDEGRLLQSREAFVECAADATCPAPIREECEQFLAAVQRLTPTMVFAGRDHLGRDVDRVRIYMDDVA